MTMHGMATRRHVPAPQHGASVPVHVEGAGMPAREAAAEKVVQSDAAVPDDPISVLAKTLLKGGFWLDAEQPAENSRNYQMWRGGSTLDTSSLFPINVQVSKCANQKAISTINQDDCSMEGVQACCQTTANYMSKGGWFSSKPAFDFAFHLKFCLDLDDNTVIAFESTDADKKKKAKLLLGGERKYRRYYGYEAYDLRLKNC
eukprot:gnl/TRDRNA2_/TRDRNA2_34227_c0_seq1.p1 gnl/TRDRNA2_/TRDRNA2_34227_c0~~gnl/TRDRNA2_/TRDRNA2_34227_c0_seq1.p1  ORF type:complete len:202 (+),score=29.02 gnl/TRDRNA2_/TRDRNA2_34227_c0_seq1:130-735(+)